MPKSITSGLSHVGKTVISDGNTFDKKKETIPGYVEDGHRPGYQGFIRGQQHYYGTTYGETTRADARTRRRRHVERRGEREDRPTTTDLPSDRAPGRTSEVGYCVG